MKNRIPTPGQEGRVLITPEDASIAPFYARMAMADNPTAEGTPLTKETLLQDSTETALWGGAADRTPDAAFAKLAADRDALETKTDLDHFLGMPWVKLVDRVSSGANASMNGKSSLTLDGGTVTGEGYDWIMVRLSGTASLTQTAGDNNMAWLYLGHHDNYDGHGLRLLYKDTTVQGNTYSFTLDRAVFLLRGDGNTLRLLGNPDTEAIGASTKIDRLLAIVSDSGNGADYMSWSHNIHIEVWGVESP